MRKNRNNPNGKHPIMHIHDRIEEEKLKKEQEKMKKEMEKEEKEKITCIFCQEKINKKSNVCPYCGVRL